MMRMAQTALSPLGGKAPNVIVRFAQEQVPEIDRLAARLGISRSELVRRAVARELGRKGHAPP